MSLAVRLLPAAAGAEAGRIWRELEGGLDAPGLMCGWDWTGTWLEQWGAEVEHWFALGERGGNVVAAALLTRDRPRRHRLLGRSLHVGTAGEPPGETVYVEGNRLLCGGADVEEFARGILTAARRDVRGWDRLRLDGFVPDDARAFARAEPRLVLEPQASPWVDLAGVREAGGDVQAALRSSVRRRARQSLRAFGELETTWAETPDEAADILEELIALHARRWEAEGGPGAFAAPRTAAFHRALVRRLPTTRLMLFRVRNEAGTVGCLYGHLDGGRLLFYQSGLAAFADNRLRAGLVTHALALQEAMARGVQAYDFLAGESRYKRELATDEGTMVWATLERRLPRPVALRAMRKLRGAARATTRRS